MVIGLLFAAVLVVHGCSSGFEAAPAPTPSLPCPPLAEYDAGEQARAKAEYDALAPDAMLRTMIDDYLLMRDQCRRERP